MSEAINQSTVNAAPDLSGWVTPAIPDPFSYWASVDEWLDAIEPGAADATAEEVKPLYVTATPASRAALTILSGRKVRS